jgi:ABC-type transport system substrate-binding protein
MPASAQEKVLRIAMTAADIPRTLGQPDQGFEGNRFTGIPMYDGLTQWDLSSADKPSVVIPALATEWASNDDYTVWTFSLRPGVTWHDGTPFTADDVAFTFNDIVLNAALAASGARNFGTIASVEVLAPHATAVLLDPVWTHPHYLQAVPGRVGLLSTLEDYGFDLEGGERRSRGRAARSAVDRRP